MTVSAYVTGITEWDIDPVSPSFGQAIRTIATDSPALDLAWGSTPDTFFLADSVVTLEERSYQMGAPIRSFEGGALAGLWAIQLSPDHQQVIAGGDNGELILWDYATGRELWRAPHQSGYVFSARFSPDGQHVFSMTAPGVPIEWNVTQLPTRDLLDWISTDRYVRDFTCAERTLYQITPLCAEPEGNP
jgi:WD40 repeat protein